MATIFEFPDTQEREWKEWQDLIRQKLNAEGVEEAVTSHALPRIKDHWLAVFEPLDLELPKRAVPGTLTKEQAKTIQGIIDAGANLVVQRLQHERRLSFERLIQAEVALSRQALRIKPPY
ncbi:MAG TPA: hypothetical protein PLA97_16170 [Rubrivivax sp.]|nr:hypothetical protein [Rubrivivax sp.]